jgi:hypothetical protein
MSSPATSARVAGQQTEWEDVPSVKIVQDTEVGCQQIEGGDVVLSSPATSARVAGQQTECQDVVSGEPVQGTEVGCQQTGGETVVLCESSSSVGAIPGLVSSSGTANTDNSKSIDELTKQFEQEGSDNALDFERLYFHKAKTNDVVTTTTTVSNLSANKEQEGEGEVDRAISDPERRITLVSLLNVEAQNMRNASKGDVSATQNLCLLMAMIVYQSGKEGDDTSTNIEECDKTFFEVNLKPILKFIIFVITYFPFSSPSQETISLWSNLKGNRQARLEVDSVVHFPFQMSKTINLDSARKIVDIKIKEFESLINYFCENMRNKQQLLEGQ